MANTMSRPQKTVLSRAGALIVLFPLYMLLGGYILAKKINQRLGEKVILFYEQKMALLQNCLGEIEYNRPADIKKAP